MVAQRKVLHCSMKQLLTLARHTLMTPRGYQLAGLSGSCGPWIDGLQIIITR